MVVNERHGLEGGIGARGGEWRFGKGERRTTGEGDGERKGMRTGRGREGVKEKWVRGSGRSVAEGRRGVVGRGNKEWDETGVRS